MSKMFISIAMSSLVVALVVFIAMRYVATTETFGVKMMGASCKKGDVCLTKRGCLSGRCR